MRLKMHAIRQLRGFALLTALCCFWASTFGALHHTDHLLAGLAIPTARSAHSGAAAHAALDSPAQPGHVCLACEWQANSVSCALPVFSVEPPAPTLPAAEPCLTCHIPSSVLLTSSRAPPAA